MKIPNEQIEIFNEELDAIKDALPSDLDLDQTTIIVISNVRNKEAYFNITMGSAMNIAKCIYRLLGNCPHVFEALNEVVMKSNSHNDKPLKSKGSC